jgi:plasmid stabilization system protein ParE
MSLPLVFHPNVQPEIDEAYLWYEQQRTGRGDDFLSAIEMVFDRIGKFPEMHQMVFQDVRRGLVSRFPYGVFYRIHPDRVEVVAVYHTSRDPRGWQARV